MSHLLSMRFWGPVLFVTILAMAGVWKLLLLWPGKGSYSQLRGRKKKLFWIIFAISIAALIFFLYYIAAVTGRFPWY